MRRVVVTGMGVVSSLGIGAGKFWENLIRGVSGISRIEQFDASEYAVKIAGEIKRWDACDYIDRRTARRLDRFCQFALVSSIQAAEDSELDFDALDKDRAGVIVGSGIGGLSEIETQHFRLIEKGASKVSPFMIPKLMINAASGQLSIHFGLSGPNSAVATACASATNAIGYAFDMIRRNYADVMITGGSEAAITPLGISGFVSMNALSRRNSDPARASRPFDKDRDGFVMGEGAGIVILEEYGYARRRGAKIYAEVIGHGMSGDAHHIAAPEPEGKGAVLAMQRALEDAGIAPEDVGYINAHGTGTPLGDLAEAIAIRSVFGDHADKLAVSSTKSMIGHLLGGSGGPEFVATVLTLQRGILPPTINRDTPDPQCNLDVVPNQAREQSIDVAMSNSFGFGGHNATLVLRKFVEG